MDPTGLDEGFAYWKFRRLTERQDSPYSVSAWKKEIRENSAGLIKWFGHLPFTNLRNIKLNRQERPVGGHIDFTNPGLDGNLWENNHCNEPCGYRVLVRGRRDGCLWVDGSDGTRYACNMPGSTDVYVLDHTAGYHGVDDDADRWTIFCHAEIEPNLHAAIIKRSLEKYGDLAIWENH
jgi:hypothetical protein